MTLKRGVAVSQIGNPLQTYSMRLLFIWRLWFFVIANPLYSQESESPSTNVILLEPNLDARASNYSGRVSLLLGDQLGGPVRYNTRFPTTATDPNPASYYHGQAFLGLGYELPLSTGAVLLEGIVRRDLAHPSIVNRELSMDSQTYSVEEFSFGSQALVFGWGFGTQYKESLWRSSLAVVTDRTIVKTTLYRVTDPVNFTSTYTLWAWSLRGRVLFKVYNFGIFDFHAGPDLHMPIYSFLVSRESENTPDWVKQTVDLKSSAAVGISLESSTTF